MAAKYLDPPAFIGPKRTYTMYRSDLMMWSRITPIKEESQAEVVVYNLEGHSSGIKEKIMTKIGETLVNNKEGIKVLVEYLDSVYKEADKCDNTGPKKNAKTEAACVAAEVGNKRLDDVFALLAVNIKTEEEKEVLEEKLESEDTGLDPWIEDLLSENMETHQQCGDERLSGSGSNG